MLRLVNHFAEALRWIDESRVPFKELRPGVGPYGEPQVVRRCLEYLRDRYPEEYSGAKTKRNPDVLIPGRWALEFKIVRPYGDNGREAEHWSQNLLHPYPGNVSSIGDIISLLSLERSEKKGVVVFTYEHDPPRTPVGVMVDCFEALARDVLRLPLGPRHAAELANLVHPVHQKATVYGWQIIVFGQ